MTPLLVAAGGHFRVDYRVEQQLAPPGPGGHDRVFVLSFPSAQAMEAFFADPAYLAVRAEHFEAAVESMHILAVFDQTS